MAQRFGEAFEVAADEIQRAAKLEDAARVDRVLRRGTPVDEARRFFVTFGDKGRKVFDERDGGVASVGGFGGDRGEIEKFGAAFGFDGFCGSGRDDACARFGAREGRFKIEHSLDGSAIREDVFDGFGVEERVEKAHAQSLVCSGVEG